jgi:hypothetical protein
MSNSIVSLQYNDQIAVSFTNDAWFNATDVARQYGKRPVDWLALESTKEYIANLCEVFKCEESSLLKTQRGKSNGGSWFSPKLAVNFARWLDVKFSIWCDMQIDKLLRPVPNALRDLPPQTLTPAMKKHINQRVNYLVKHQVGASYASLGKLIQDTFNVNKRELILASKYPEICALLDCEPDPKALQGELLEPAKIATPEFNPTSPTLTLDHVTNQTVIFQQHNGVTISYVAEKGTMIGTPENIIRDLTAMGYCVVKNDPADKLQTIVKIAGFVA